MGTDTETSDEPTSGSTKTRARKKKRKKRRAESDGDRPSRKKKRREKKVVEGGAPKGETEDQADGSDEAEPKGRRMRWLAFILVIAVIELFLFGNRGRIEVCVAKEGVHDFALLGTPRNDDNTHRFPSCETRLNVGMKSRFDEAKTDAVLHACRRANIFRGKDAILTCAVEADGWQHRVKTDFVMPWEEAYTDRLFWFLP